MLEGKAVIGETDMLEAMQQDALDLAAKALDIFDVTEATEIARFIKKVLKLFCYWNSRVPQLWWLNSLLKLFLSDDMQEFDRTYGAGWQCIVGTDFGSFVTHCFGCFIYFRIGSVAILLFRGSAACQEPDEPAADQFANFETVKA